MVVAVESGSGGLGVDSGATLLSVRGDPGRFSLRIESGEAGGVALTTLMCGWGEELGTGERRPLRTARSLERDRFIATGSMCRVGGEGVRWLSPDKDFSKSLALFLSMTFLLSSSMSFFFSPLMACLRTRLPLRSCEGRVVALCLRMATRS